MRKILTGIIVFSLLLSISFSQGIGFEFHTLPTSISSEANGTIQGLYFPIKSGGFIIEPHISYYSNSIAVDYDGGSDYEENTITWSMTAGVFKSFENGNLKSYAGVRIGKLWSVYEETDEEDVESESLITAPTIGAEYFISENFSFGGECMYFTVTNEIEEDYYTIEAIQTRITPVFIVRFYF